MTASTVGVQPVTYPVFGVDPDAVVTAVQGCAAVAAMHGGPYGEVVTYLPGRRVVGVQVTVDAVTVGVVARWGIPIAALRTQIALACAPMIVGQRIDVLVGDIAEPPTVGEPTVPPAGLISSL